MNENSHRFPALVLAAGLTTAVVIGLSALAQSRATMATPVSQAVATKASVAQVAVEEADVARLRIDVVATRS
ncbi:MAG TPA: hypothetical protein VHJ55_04205 [Casimicrobiaceae bacterium]|nr:hypothetical protein [Casimicrobiaceae bacterium]